MYFIILPYPVKQEIVSRSYFSTKLKIVSTFYIPLIKDRRAVNDWHMPAYLPLTGPPAFTVYSVKIIGY
ncbi:hypothetical protein DWX43_05835 [Clostridium sp. AF19-22AC]|jgi:hypothetical protein|nr:hypothetical protein DWX43_05835 [Clostridium sp. AF19-22AC]